MVPRAQIARKADAAKKRLVAQPDPIIRAGRNLCGEHYPIACFPTVRHKIKVMQFMLIPGRPSSGSRVTENRKMDRPRANRYFAFNSWKTTTSSNAKASAPSCRRGSFITMKQTGRRPIECLRAGQPDVILLRHALARHGQDGWTVLDAFATTRPGRRSCIIVTPGIRLQEWARSLGAVGHRPQPGAHAKVDATKIGTRVTNARLAAARKPHGAISAAYEPPLSAVIHGHSKHAASRSLRQ